MYSFEFLLKKELDWIKKKEKSKTIWKKINLKIKKKYEVTISGNNGGLEFLECDFPIMILITAIHDFFKTPAIILLDAIFLKKGLKLLFLDNSVSIKIKFVKHTFEIYFRKNLFFVNDTGQKLCVIYGSILVSVNAVH